MGGWYPPGRSRVWNTGFPMNQAQGLPGRRELDPPDSRSGRVVSPGLSCQGIRGRSRTQYPLRDTSKVLHPQPEGGFRRALKDEHERSFVCSDGVLTEVGAPSGTRISFPTFGNPKIPLEGNALWMLGQSNPIRTTWTEGRDMFQAKQHNI